MLESDDLIHGCFGITVVVSDHNLGKRGLDTSKVSLFEVIVVLDAGFDVDVSHVLVHVSLTIVEPLEEINDLGLGQAVKAVLV